MIEKLIHRALNFLFPQKCLSCGKENEVLCGECLKRIDWPSLIKENNIFSASNYNDEIIKKAIWMLKYRGIKRLAEPLAELMFRRLWPKIDKTDWLIAPIPISPKSLKKRGFNQAELISKHLFAKVKPLRNAQGLTLCKNVLYKIKETPSQVSIKNREERLKNLNGAFAVKNSRLIAGRNILLIDDVSTTGATIREARRVLRESGAKRIIVAVVARG